MNIELKGLQNIIVENQQTKNSIYDGLLAKCEKAFKTKISEAEATILEEYEIYRKIASWLDGELAEIAPELVLQPNRNPQHLYRDLPAICQKAWDKIPELVKWRNSWKLVN